MNETFPSKMADAAAWLMLDPVLPEHTTTVIGLCLVLGVLSFRKMAESLGASNWSLPMAVIAYALGLATMLGGLAVADLLLLPIVPKDVPFAAYAGTVLVVLLLAVAAPIGKFLMKCGYAATASAWVTALMVSAVIVFLADLGFTHYAPPMVRVVDIKGPVTYRLAKGESLEEMKHRRIGLPAGAEISTKSAASITLCLGGENFLTLRPTSLLRIVTLGEKTHIELDSGRVIGAIQQTSKTSFKIQTPATTATIGGADFSVLTDSVKQTFITSASGKITVISTKTGGSIELGSGQAANCPSAASPTPPRKADAADLKTIESFKGSLSETKNQRHRQIEKAL